MTRIRFGRRAAKALRTMGEAQFRDGEGELFEVLLIGSHDIYKVVGRL